MTHSTRAERVPISFGEEVPAASTERIRHEVEHDATIEKVGIRIYRGAELDVRVRVEVHKQWGNEYSAIEQEGKGFIDGDDDRYLFSLAEPVEEGDEVVIEVENRDGSNAYDARVNVELDRFGGVERVERAIESRLREVL